MKKLLALLLTLALCLGLAAPVWAEEYSDAKAPAEIAAMMAKITAQGYREAGYTQLENLGWAFAVFQNDSGHNLLTIYQQKNGAWKEYLRSDSALPQGTKILSLSADAHGYDHDLLGLSVHTPVFVVWQANSDKEDETEYAERYAIYTLSGGKWLLQYWEDFYGDTSLWVAGDSLIYNGAFPGEYRYKGTVRGTIQRDVRYVNLSSLPLTYKEARQRLTDPPAIPAGELTAQRIQFTGGQKYPVYSGPGENYLRANNGKAAVSTNDWIQVFGKQNGWIMIQYAIGKDHMRFGWINEKALPRNAQVEELRLDAVRVYTVVETAITDDPLFSGSMLAAVPECNYVTWLSTMGDWAYVEWFDDEASPKPVRGFLPVNDLVHLEQETVLSLAMEYLLSQQISVYDRPLTEYELREADAMTAYDQESHEWTVTFDLNGDYAWYVAVDDQNGTVLGMDVPHG